MSSWDPRPKEMWANRKESSRVLVKLLGAGAYAVLESGGTALFSLKMRKLKVDLIPAFHYLERKASRSQTPLTLVSTGSGAGQLLKKKQLLVTAGESLMGHWEGGGGVGVGWGGLGE